MKLIALKHKRALLTFTSVLFLFMMISNFIIISHESTVLHKKAIDNARREIELITSFTSEALVRQEYSAVEQFMTKWGEEHPDVIDIQAVASNGFILAHFFRETASTDLIKVATVEQLQDIGFITLKMTLDHSPSKAGLTKLSWQLISISLALIGILGIILWYSIRNLALKPMENEIARRKQAEEKFRMLLELAPDALIFINKEGNIALANAQAEILFGYKKEAMIGQKLEFLMPERYRAAHHKYRDDFFNLPRQRPMGVSLDLYGLNSRGIEFPVEIGLSPVTTNEGLFVLADIRDVTVHKRADDEIKKGYIFQRTISSILQTSIEQGDLKLQLQKILINILALPWLKTLSMGCIYIKENTSDNLIMVAHKGLPSYTLDTCSSVPVGHCLCGLSALKREIIFTDCNDARHEKTSPGDIHHAHYCIPLLSGDITLGVFNLYVPKGHHKNKEEEDMMQSIANTIAGIIERNRAMLKTLDLQKQLVQSEKLSALGRLTANVAHEIRNPLVAIGGFARRLSTKTPDNTKEKEYSDIITKEVLRLENILRNVLIYSKTHEPNIEKHSINALINESLKNAEPMLQDNHITLNTSLVDDTLLCIDIDQIKEVLSNIIVNAVDSMPDGGELNIQTESIMKQNRPFLSLRITDTGEGIADNIIDKIFEPFFSTKIIGRGTGLGLSICKKIMEDHGGYIEVESNPGKGSAFILYFPCHAAPECSANQ
ncbi:MAG: PAS domain S-box protein [Nitrospira sp.]|nr:PAS domain S-box protein [bacterium]MBL7048132.1 PAS domain S-box protein [Nitrospira sp.]